MLKMEHKYFIQYLLECVNEYWSALMNILKSLKSDARTQFRQAMTGQTQHGPDKEAQDSLPEEVGGGWWPGQAGQLTRSADLARGPHCLIQDTCRLLIGPQGRLQGPHPMAPCYKYKGGRDYDTHTHTPHFLSSLALLAQSLGLVEFRRSLGVIESPVLLESLIWVHLQFSLVIFDCL